MKARHVAGRVGKQVTQMELIIEGLDVLRRLVRALGPYVMLEIVLPGGTLIALLLFFYRRGGFGYVAGVLRSLRARPGGVWTSSSLVTKSCVGR
jgi:hypothetical protein